MYKISKISKLVILFMLILSSPVLSEEVQSPNLPFLETNIAQTGSSFGVTLPGSPQSSSPAKAKQLQQTPSVKTQIQPQQLKQKSLPGEQLRSPIPQSVYSQVNPVPGTSKPEKEEQAVKTPDIEDVLQKPDLTAEIKLNLKEEPVPVDLEYCLKTALEKNYNIKIITAEKDQNKWLYKNALTDFLPNLTYQYLISRASGDFVVGGLVPVERLTTEPVESNYYFNWKIFDGLNNYFTAKAAKYKYKASQETVNYTQEQALLNTTSQYYTLLQDKLNIRVLTANLKQREAQLKLNTDRFNAGVGTKFDQLRAEAEVASARQNLILAYNNFRLSQAQLANTLGLDIFTPVYPKEEEVKTNTLVNEKCKLEELSDIAIKARPDLKAANYQVTSAKATRKSYFSTYWPVVNLNGQLADQGTLETAVARNYLLQVRVDWSGGTGMGLTGYTNIKAGDAQVKQAELTATNLGRTIQNDLLNSYYDSITAKERIKAAQEEVDSANEGLRLANLRLESGIGIFVDVLQAQATAIEAELRLINATADYNIAQAQMLFDMGIISVNNILDGFGQNDETNIEEKPKNTTTNKKITGKPKVENSTKNKIEKKINKK